jgi:arginyl-tRNA synthetase
MNILTLITSLQTRFPNYEWVLPPKLELGVLSTNEAFKQATLLKQNPSTLALSIGSEIEEYLVTEQLPFKVTTVGPYINITPTTTHLNSILKSGFDYTLNQDERVLLMDYFSPNVGKQMHIGHMRSGNIGEALRRLFILKGTQVITDNHIADCGIQFAILIWGVEHLPQLKLGIMKLDFDELSAEEVIDYLNQIYIATNALIESNPEIRENAQLIAGEVEASIKSNTTHKHAKRFELIQQIVEVNNRVFSSGESYLSLNESQPITESPITSDIARTLQDQPGVWGCNEEHRSGEFDLVLGESFYLKYLGEIDYWAEMGLLVKDGDGYYIDLEEEGLGRAYLITSKGYSIYVGRDTLARFVWAGLLGAQSMISIADNRQNHSFKQVFMVVDKVIKSGIYDTRNFGNLTSEQTKRAVSTLSNKPPIHIGFGFIKLKTGVMSGRKGTVVKFHDFIATLEQEVDVVLSEKSKDLRKNQYYYSKVQKLATATIKWFDLSRDKDQDIVFDPAQMLSFEGNTGIYQLYTYARITNILARTETTAQLNNTSISLLNATELTLLHTMYTLPYILESAISSLSPHILANHLLQLSSLINSWYASNSVAGEEDDARRDALLSLCRLMQAHLKLSLELLAIEPLDKI